MNRNSLTRRHQTSDQTGKNSPEHGALHQKPDINPAEKLNELDADEQADICESLHDHADELYRSCLARFGDDGEAL